MVRQCAAHTHTHNSIRLSGWKCVTSQMHWYEHTTIEQQIGVAENKIKHLGIKLCDFQSFFTWWPTISRKLSFSNGVGVVETNAMAMTTATHKKPHIRQLTMVISQLKINFSHLNLLIIQCDHVFIILGVHVVLLIRERARACGRWQFLLYECVDAHAQARCVQTTIALCLLHMHGSQKLVELTNIKLKNRIFPRHRCWSLNRFCSAIDSKNLGMDKKTGVAMTENGIRITWLFCPLWFDLLCYSLALVVDIPAFSCFCCRWKPGFAPLPMRPKGRRSWRICVMRLPWHDNWELVNKIEIL